MIAQRRRLRISDAEAYARAWKIIAAVNPLPATLGRICPNPCESGCRRGSEGGAVAIRALERFLGDWALRQRLALPILDQRPQPESIGVVGAGPAGLSFAYQMARRGYRVTVYEKREEPGGMLSYGIPPFRLPMDVLEAEVRRVLDIGVELRRSTTIGRDVSAAELRCRHSVLFLGIGAARGARLNIPGERGSGVWPGVEYLAATKRGESVALGSRVIVIGGGNTAVDAARVARRGGARVTILYRRASSEMPAIAREIEAALSEGVTLRCLSSPVRIERSRGVVTGVFVQRMRPAEADASGRRRSRPLAHTGFTLPADSVIAAISQEPEWGDLAEFEPPDRLEASQGIESRSIRVFAGGDALKPGIAGIAIAHGRRAAEAAHAKLRGLPGARPNAASATTPGPVVKAEYYPSKERVRQPSRAARECLVDPAAEVEQTMSEQAFLGEVTRCFSCGLCFGCEQCFMYCSAGAFSRLDTTDPGLYFALSTDRCEGCGKCVELCPSGFLSVALAL